MTLAPLSLALVGLLLGIRHALDPDHVVAVSTFATRTGSFRRALFVGALWGVGHTVTVLVAGGAIIALELAVPPRAGLAMELAVAVMLILLGVVNLVNARRGTPVAPSASRPVLVGMVHGLAGSSAIALLVVAAAREVLWGVAYLVLFGVGTVVGMIVVTGMITVPASLMVARTGVSQRWLTAAAGVVSVAFGLLLAHGLLGPDGLLSAAPAWSPR
jgi:high-affinity nickel-transport protein